MEEEMEEEVGYTSTSPLSFGNKGPQAVLRRTGSPSPGEQSLGPTQVEEKSREVTHSVLSPSPRRAGSLLPLIMHPV